MSSKTLRPLAEGNRLQRAYARWAEPHYRRMPADTRESAELLDRFLYSRRGLGLWVGLLCAVVGTAAGLRGAGMPWGLALLGASLCWIGLGFITLTAWLVPAKVVRGLSLLKLGIGAGLGLVGALAGFAVGHVVKRGSLDFELLMQSLWRELGVLMPAALGAVLGMFVLTWGVAHIRRGILQQQLERTALEREAAEARLRLLQAQIQPHFLFNTLSALQHWVDTSDSRAPALLRSLTAFLRGSTELLGRSETSVADEATLAAHYLAIQQARLGARLTTRIDIAPEMAHETLPPGVLLSLVENAIEHGITPSLAGGGVTVIGAHDDQGWTLAVRDTGVGLAGNARDGIGLANSRARLQHHFGARATLQLNALATGTAAVIRIECPLTTSPA